MLSVYFMQGRKVVEVLLDSLDTPTTFGVLMSTTTTVAFPALSVILMQGVLIKRSAER